MAWVKLDENYQFDPKILAAGALAELLYVRSLAWAKRFWKDEGRIDARHLAPLVMGMPGKPATHITALVDNELWTVVDGGWLITAWAKRNNTADVIERIREDRRKAGAKGNANRHANSGATIAPEAAAAAKTEADPEAAAAAPVLAAAAAAAFEIWIQHRMKTAHSNPIALGEGIRRDDVPKYADRLNELAARGKTATEIATAVFGLSDRQAREARPA